MIYLPKQISQRPANCQRLLFFLAGPIRGGGDWQASMAELLFKHDNDIDIACPCRWTKQHRLSGWFYAPFSQAENRQVVWERYHLHRASNDIQKPGCTIYWLPLESVTDPHPGPEPYGMDTRRELGKLTAYLEMIRDFPWLRSQFSARFVIGGHCDFHGLSTILDELSIALGKEVPFYEDMETCVQHAFVAARQ